VPVCRYTTCMHSLLCFKCQPPFVCAAAAAVCCVCFRHGDLKAGNVLLTGNSTPSSNQGCSSHLHRALEAWVAAGSQPLSAKVCGRVE